MSSGELYRSFAPELEVRSGGDGRTIYGIAVPYNVEQRIDGTLVESFAEGAFAAQLRAIAAGRPAAHMVRFAREHVQLGGSIIGATVLLRDDPLGLYGEWRVSKTPLGDETLELVRDGALRELSIGFREGQNRRLRSGAIQRVTATVFETAVTMQGAYGDLAVAAGVRSAAFEATLRPGLDEAARILAGLPKLPR